MKKYINNYLTENYFLDKSVVGNAGIYDFDDERPFKVPINAKTLIKELQILFGYSFTRTKWLINNWAKQQNPDYCLNFYWNSNDVYFNNIDELRFVRTQSPILLSTDLISIQPMDPPSYSTLYLENNYGVIEHVSRNKTIDNFENLAKKLSSLYKNKNIY